MGTESKKIRKAAADRIKRGATAAVVSVKDTAAVVILILAHCSFANASETAGEMATRAWKVAECGIFAARVSAYCSDPNSGHDLVAVCFLEENDVYEKAWMAAFAKFLELARGSIRRARDFATDEEYREKFHNSAPLALSLAGGGPSVDFVAGRWVQIIQEAVQDSMDEDLGREWDEYTDFSMDYDYRESLQIQYMERQYSDRNCKFVIGP